LGIGETNPWSFSLGKDFERTTPNEKTSHFVDIDHSVNNNSGVTPLNNN